jgi:hypothetical protein
MIIIKILTFSNHAGDLPGLGHAIKICAVYLMLQGHQCAKGGVDKDLDSSVHGIEQVSTLLVINCEPRILQLWDFASRND